MSWDALLGYLVGPHGGLFALGVIFGAAVHQVYLGPKIYGERITALEKRVEELQRELQPFREIQTRLMNAALDKKT